MSTHMQRSADLAEKITAFAEDGVRNLDIVIKGWPDEFRAIMWDAVAEIAKHRAAAARRS
jgi:hypothetical protein